MSPSPSSKRPFSITQQKLKLVCEFAGIQKSTLEINAKKKKKRSQTRIKKGNKNLKIILHNLKQECDWEGSLH